jgi:hypothetical protein
MVVVAAVTVAVARVARVVAGGGADALFEQALCRGQTFVPGPVLSTLQVKIQGFATLVKTANQNFRKISCLSNVPCPSSRLTPLQKT